MMMNLELSVVLVLATSTARPTLFAVELLKLASYNPTNALPILIVERATIANQLEDTKPVSCCLRDSALMITNVINR